jgi:hypothetical protein
MNARQELIDELNAMTDVAFSAAVKSSDFRFSNVDAARECMSVAMSELGLKSDAEDPKRWGACHQAANRVNGWLRASGISAGDWTWTALLGAFGVDMVAMERAYEAERAAQK